MKAPHITQVADLSSIDFAELLKVCMIRLQDENKKVLRVDHCSNNESSIIFPYVESNQAEATHFAIYGSHALGVFETPRETKITHLIK